MNRRKGFTLIELLVVVAIIAVLIAILLPSLGRAKDQAKKVRCASNLKAIGQTALVYSMENGNWLPAESFAYASSNYSPQRSATVLDNKNGNVWYSAALMVTTKNLNTGKTQQGTISDIRVFFCPSQPSDEFQYNNTGGSWEEWFKNLTNADAARFIGYMYQVHAKVTGSPSKWRAEFPKADKFPRGKILTVDILANQQAVAHGLGSSASWNALWIDGHAENVKNAATWNMMNNGKDLRKTNGVGSSYDQGAWPFFGQAIQNLEQTSGN